MQLRLWLLALAAGFVSGCGMPGVSNGFSPANTAPLMRYELDLASATVERRVNPGVPFELTVTNRLPKTDYRVTVEQIPIPIPEFEDLPEPIRKRGVMDQPDPCADEEAQLLIGLEKAAQETEVRHVIARAKASADWRLCQSRLQSIITEFTVYPLNETFTLGRGEQLIVTVERKAQADSAEWRFVLSTGPRGEWRTTYGFTFVPSGDERYFSRQMTEDASKFIITEENDPEGSDLDFVPSVLRTWYPGSQRLGIWSAGLTGGLGFDFKNLALFGGLAATYNENLTFTLGGIIHEEQRLNPRYSAGDTITENLGPEGLHIERFYPSFYLGIGFRFGSNPFEEPSTPPRAGSRPEAGSQTAAPRERNEDEEGETESDTEFDLANVRPGLERGDLRVDSVREANDHITVTFTRNTTVSGTYAPQADGTLCINLDEESSSILPHPQGDSPERLCLKTDEKVKQQFAGVEEGEDVGPVTIVSYRVSFKKTEPENAEYTAELLSREPL